MTNQTRSGSEGFGTTSGTSAAGDQVRDTAEQAKETLGQATSQAKQAVGQATGQAREQVSSRLSGQKDRAAHGLGSMANALRMTGQQLRDQDQAGATEYIDRVASEVERFSSYLEQHDVGELVGEVERFARRQPALFLGGAFVLGLLGARFLKSSSPDQQQMGQYPLMQRDNFSTTPGYYGQEYERAVGGATYDTPTRGGPRGGMEGV